MGRVERIFSVEERHRILDDWHAGPSAEETAARHGIAKSTLMQWARALGRRKRDNPDAVYAWKPPPRRLSAAARVRRAITEAGRAPETAEEGAGFALGLALEALREGRPEQAWSWSRTARALRQVPKAVRPGAGEIEAEGGDAPDVNPGEAFAPHDAQRPPPGAWRTWLFLGGRGAGKTRAGAEWLAGVAEDSPGARLALVGPALHDVREVMVDGPSGLMRLPGRERPRWEASRRRLVWSNDAAAYAFSAEDPESLRGPQFAAAWADEFCVWPKPGETLALLRMGLRTGADPRLAVTTTPKPIAALRTLIAEPACEVTRAATGANAAWLAPAFVEGLRALYGGTRLEAQELEGVLLDAPEGALWRAQDLARCRGPAPARLERVVVAVDPPASAGGNACGIVAAGRLEGRAYVLADRTARGLGPGAWAARAVAVAAEFGADVIVAEANQGGDMVRSVLAQAEPPCAVRLVHARFGKRVRAEPVAALYEQGRVTHCGALAALEEEMLALGAEEGGPSPDRADALVWALTELMLGMERAGPRLRVL